MDLKAPPVRTWMTETTWSSDQGHGGGLIRSLDVYREARDQRSGDVKDDRG